MMMKNLAAALTFGILIAAPVFVPTAGAAPPSDDLDEGRARAIRECMAIQNKDPYQSYGKTGNFDYRTCMDERGRME